MTPATITDRLAAMTHKIGDLFLDMDVILMLVERKRSTNGKWYWLCEDMSGRSSGQVWFSDKEITAGKKLLDWSKEQ